LSGNDDYTTTLHDVKRTKVEPSEESISVDEPGSLVSGFDSPITELFSTTFHHHHHHVIRSAAPPPPAGGIIHHPFNYSQSGEIKQNSSNKKVELGGIVSNLSIELLDESEEVDTSILLSFVVVVSVC
jgi:hypothetical protein